MLFNLFLFLKPVAFLELSKTPYRSLSSPFELNKKFSRIKDAIIIETFSYQIHAFEIEIKENRERLQEKHVLRCFFDVNSLMGC